MAFQILRSISLLVVLGLFSCKSQKDTSLQERIDKDNFFRGIEKTADLSDLENEMDGGETNFLRSFAVDSIPWQHWDSSVLKKARDCQVPIFLFVGSSLGGESHLVKQELAESPELRALLAGQFVCSVADIRANPELGILSFYLSSEINHPARFPTLIWMSPEGSPIAWIPIASLASRELGIMINKAGMTVKKIWEEGSEYAVTNSRRDNSARQNRLRLPIPEDTTETAVRTEVFRTQTRQLCSLYSAGDRDLDFIGGLLPTGSLELLALGSVTNLVTEEVNERCLRATTGVIEEILGGGLKDPLDGSYFFARRTSTWSLASFSKNITTQTRVLHMLIQAGEITGRQDFIEEALRILDILETEWIAKSRVQVSPIGDQDIPGKFLWNWSSLEKAIGRDLVPFAESAFSIEKDGNIPSVADPVGNFFRLNSLRSRTSIPELATRFELTEQEAGKMLSEVKTKMLNYREQNTQFGTESIMNCPELALILRSFTAAYSVSRDPAHLEKAKSFAARLSSEFINPENGLARLPLSAGYIPARASDYATCSIALNELYQITLNPDYLKLSKSLIDEAFEKLKCDNGLISVAPEEERIIPLEIIQPSMIFSDSPLSLIDLATTQLKGITGTEEYDEFRSLINQIIPPIAERSIVNHTDFISTCARGDSPVIAVFQGDPLTTSGRELIFMLNSRKNLPFLSVRSETGPLPLTKLKDLPALSGEASVVLIRSEEVLGQAANIEQLEQLINQELFTRD